MADTQLCAGCLRFKEEKETDLWCRECNELVCQQCADVHKKLLPVHDIVGRQQIERSTKPIIETIRLSRTNPCDLMTSMTKCSLHEDQNMDLFCADHNIITCVSCVADTHLNCTSVIPIEQAAIGVKNENLSACLTTELLDVIHSMERLMGELNHDLSELNGQRKYVKERIAKIKNELILHLDSVEVELDQEVSKKCNEFKNKINSRVQDLRHIYEFLNILQFQIPSIHTNGTEIQLFRMLKFIENETLKQKERVKHIECKRTERKKGSLSSDHVTNLVEELSSVDQLPVSDQMDSVDSHERRISLVKSFKSGRIKDNLRVFRCCFIPGNRLLFCAFNEYYLFSCNHDGSDVVKIPFDFQPIGVALYNSTRAIVTLSTHGIQIIDLVTMAPGKLIETEGDYRAVYIMDEQIWVRSAPWALSLIGVDGKIIKQINTIFDPRDIFFNGEGDIFSSSNLGDKVYMITTSGQQKEFYGSPDLKLPKGVAVDNNGYVYVCGYISYNIHRISPKGHGEVILNRDDGIKQPRGMTYYGDTNQLLLILEDGETVNIYNVH